MNLTDDNIAKCEACRCVMDVTMMQPFTNVECPECNTHNRVKVDVGSYILKKRQGVGGMSLVFGAVDKTLGREVAIKILNENYSMDEKRIAQFEQEAKITAAISHPHVVRVYTVGQAFERFFIAMELVPGDSLEKKMHDEGKLPENDVLAWGRQVCEGLNAANEAGLIHRDIKPGNILFDAEGHVKIVDFGLALMTQGGKAQADEIWATPYYVPPETLDVLEEDFRSDIYALGASLFHALTGQPPFNTETRSTTELKEIKRNLESLKKSAPWLSDETCAVIDKAMEFDMNDRFSSYKEMIDALHRAEMTLENEGMQPVTHSSERYQRRGRVSSGKLYGIIAICLLLVGGVIAALSMGGKDEATDDDSSVENGALGIEGSDDGGAAGKRLSIAIREGRNALSNKNYNKAASRYAVIAGDNRFTMNTAMWAGLQSSIVSWISGKPGDAKHGLRNLAKRYEEAKKKGKVSDPTEMSISLAESIPSLLKMERIDPAGYQNIQTEVQAMLVFASALKNWEDGYISESVKLLEKVESYSFLKGTDISEEFKFYAIVLEDYKHDASLMQPYLEGFFPTDDAAIDAQREKLNVTKTKIKTQGRAVENVEEWLIQLDIHKNRLAYERKMVIDKQTKEQPDNAKNQGPKDDWDGFLKSLEKDLDSASFTLVSEKLKLRTFKGKKSNEKKEQMIYLSKKAAGFIGTLSETLSKGVVRAQITLKDGKEFTSFTNIDSKGISVKDGNDVRKVFWGEITTKSVIELHQLSVNEGDLSQFEKNLRLEQAISYAWLGGEKDKARMAAGNLQKANPLFKDRWIECMRLLDTAK